jgi:hypothetical protein
MGSRADAQILKLRPARIRIEVTLDPGQQCIHPPVRFGLRHGFWQRQTKSCEQVEAECQCFAVSGLIGQAGDLQTCRCHQQEWIGTGWLQRGIDRVRVVLAAKAAECLMPTGAQGKQQGAIALARLR